MGLVFISSEKNAIVFATMQAPGRTVPVVEFPCSVAHGTTGALPACLAVRAGTRVSFQISPASGPWHMPSPPSGTPTPTPSHLTLKLRLPPLAPRALPSLQAGLNIPCLLSCHPFVNLLCCSIPVLRLDGCTFLSS